VSILWISVSSETGFLTIFSQISSKNLRQKLLLRFDVLTVWHLINVIKQDPWSVTYSTLWLTGSCIVCIHTMYKMNIVSSVVSESLLNGQNNKNNNERTVSYVYKCKTCQFHLQLTYAEMLKPSFCKFLAVLHTNLQMTNFSFKYLQRWCLCSTLARVFTTKHFFQNPLQR
jgi:hypothetical protein